MEPINTSVDTLNGYTNTGSYNMVEILIQVAL